MAVNYRDKILNELEEWLYSVDDKEINTFIGYLCSSDRIICYGAGRMGLSLRPFVMRLNHFGKEAYFYGGDYTPPVNENDLYIFASASGETKSVLVIAEIAKKTKCKIVAITGSKNSSLAKLADHVVSFKSCNGGFNAPDDVSKINSFQLMTTLNEQGTYILYDLIIRRWFDIAQYDEKDLRSWHNNVE